MRRVRRRCIAFVTRCHGAAAKGSPRVRQSLARTCGAAGGRARDCRRQVCVRRLVPRLGQSRSVRRVPRRPGRRRRAELAHGASMRTPEAFPPSRTRPLPPPAAAHHRGARWRPHVPARRVEEEGLWGPGAEGRVSSHAWRAVSLARRSVRSGRRSRCTWCPPTSGSPGSRPPRSGAFQTLSPQLTSLLHTGSHTAACDRPQRMPAHKGPGRAFSGR